MDTQVQAVAVEREGQWGSMARYEVTVLAGAARYWVKVVRLVSGSVYCLRVNRECCLRSTTTRPGTVGQRIADAAVAAIA